MDPAFLAAAGTIGTVTLTAALDLCRDQIGLLLQRRRARSVAAAAPEVLDGTLTLDDLDESALAESEAGLQQLWFESGPRPGDPDVTEEETRARVEAMRETLETVLRQHITFNGEDRPATGTPVTSTRAEGPRIITVTGHRNVAVGGDNRGSITIGS